MRVQVKISFKEKDVANVFIDESTLPAQINVANSNAVITGLSKGARGFQLSSSTDSPVSVLDGSSTAFPSTGYPGIITSELSAADGTCDISIPFTLTGSTPDNLYIEFDHASKEYATDILLTNNYNTWGITRSNNKEMLLIIPLASMYLPSTLNGVQFTLRITKWSKGNSSIKITRLSSYYSTIFTGRDIISTSNSENSFDSQMQITPGICEQYIDTQLYDRNGTLKTFAQSGKLTPDYVINISAIDGEDVYEMGSYIISEWNFNGTDSVVGVSGRDKSHLFEKINTVRSTIADRTLDALITILFAQAADVPWRYQDTETQERCQSILIPDNWYLASDLYTMLNKICALGMLRIYWFVDAFIIGRCC